MFPGKESGCNHSERDTFSVEHLEILILFDRMTYGMAKIQQRAVALLGRILFNHELLDCAAPHDHLFQYFAVAIVDLIHMLQKPLVEHGVLDQR